MSDQLNNPLTKAWLYHHQLSIFLYLSSTILFERLLASSTLGCVVRAGPLTCSSWGECCVVCVAKKTRAQPPASTSTNEPEIMHHELSTTSLLCSHLTKVIKKYLKEFYPRPTLNVTEVTLHCVDCEVHTVQMDKFKTVNLNSSSQNVN